MATPMRRALPHKLRRHRQSRPMSSAVDWTDIDLNGSPPPGAVVEHLIPAFIVARLSAVANHGRHWEPRPFRMDGQKTPAGPATRTPPMGDIAFWTEHWNNPAGLPAGLPPVTSTSPDLRRPADRVFEAVGSTTNPYAMTMMQDRLQTAKTRLESYTEPISAHSARALLHRATAPDGSGGDGPINDLIAPLQEASAVFEFTRDPEIARQIQAIRGLVAAQLMVVEQHCPGAQGFTAHWDEFYPYYFSAVSEFARRWARRHIGEMRTAYEASRGAYARDAVLEELLEREKKVEDMRYAFEA